MVEAQWVIVAESVLRVDIHLLILPVLRQVSAVEEIAEGDNDDDEEEEDDEAPRRKKKAGKASSAKKKDTAAADPTATVRLFLCVSLRARLLTEVFFVYVCTGRRRPSVRADGCE